MTETIGDAAAITSHPVGFEGDTLPFHAHPDSNFHSTTSSGGAIG
jgi:hypothetical protein